MKQPNTRGTIASKRLSTEMKMYVALFLVATLGGAIRKWFTNSSSVSNSVLLIQMLIPFGMWLFRSANSYNPFKKYSILIWYVGYLVFHIIHPQQHTIFHGMLGVVIYGGMWLAFYHYLANRHLFNFRRIEWVFFIIVGLEIILAFIQYSLPSNHILNTYANLENVGGGIALIGKKVRVTGTFSYLSGYTAFLLFLPFYIWTLMKRGWNPILPLIVSAAGLAVAFMTGSRAGVGLYILMTGAIILQEYPLNYLGKLISRSLIPIVIIITASLILKDLTLREQITEAFDNFIQRVTTNRESGEEQSRLFWDYMMLTNSNFPNPIFGIGLGATYQGSIALFGASPLIYSVGYLENELPRMILEGGVIIVFFKLALAIYLMRNLKIKGAIGVITFVVIVYATPVIFNVHDAAFLFLGISLADNTLWRQDIEKRRKKMEEAAKKEEREMEAVNQFAVTS